MGDDVPGARPGSLANLKVLAFVWRQWMRRPLQFAVMSGLLVIAAGVDLSIPFATGRLIGAVSAPIHRAEAAAGVWEGWATLSVMYAAFYLLRQGAFRVMNGFSARNMEELVNDAFSHVQAFSSEWHADTLAGTTVHKIGRGMWAYRSVSDMLLILLGPSLIVLVGLSISMALRAPLAGAAEFALVCLYMGVSVVMTTHWARPANLQSTALDGRIGGALADAFSGNAAVKSFGAEDAECSRIACATAAWRDAVIRAGNRFMDLGGAMNLLLMTLQAIPTGLVVQSWIEGRASASDVAFAVTSFMLMAAYLRNFSDMVRNFQKGIDDLEPVAAFANAQPTVMDRPEAPDLAPGGGGIEFDRVVFRYKNAPRPVYDGLSIRIAPGERVALVGSTGAGKSTFVKLIQRLYDVEGGAIRIDGQNVAMVTQRSLRRAIAVVPQDPALFHRSLAENIAYARPQASLEEISEAARRASAHEFISCLPKGYDTLVGERGVKLSGGERQRVAIARAFLADAPILLLDEATSSLDVQTEQEVQAAMEALVVGRTTIIIAHRLSTIRNADRILVFSGGCLVEEGRHRDLVESSGPYARLHAINSR